MKKLLIVLYYGLVAMAGCGGGPAAYAQTQQTTLHVKNYSKVDSVLMQPKHRPSLFNRLFKTSSSAAIREPVRRSVVLVPEVPVKFIFSLQERWVDWFNAERNSDRIKFGYNMYPALLWDFEN
jgi:hypothetical protein